MKQIRDAGQLVFLSMNTNIFLFEGVATPLNSLFNILSAYKFPEIFNGMDLCVTSFSTPSPLLPNTKRKNSNNNNKSGYDRAHKHHYHLLNALKF